MRKDLQAAHDALEVKACEVEKDLIRYKHFSDLGEHLDPIQCRRMDERMEIITIELKSLYLLIDEFQQEIEQLNNKLEKEAEERERRYDDAAL